MRPAASPLPWIVHRMLAVRTWNGNADVVVEAEDWLDLWHTIDADDARIAYGLWLALPRCIDFEERPLPRLLWVKVDEDWRNQSVTLTWWWEGGAPQVVGMSDLVAVARKLMAADDPPVLTMPAAPAIPAPPVAFQGCEAKPVVSRIGRPVQPKTPSPAPRPQAKALPSAQLSLF